MNLTTEHWQALSFVSKAKKLVWCGVFDNGGDDVIAELAASGLIEGVKQHIRIGRMNYSGGYRITPAGRNALDKERGG